MRGKTVCGLMLAVTLGGCQRAPHVPDVPDETYYDSRPPAAGTAEAQLTWTLRAVPATVRLSDARQVRLSLTLTNHGTAAIHPHRVGDVVVDGVASDGLSDAFGNGGFAHDGPWVTLAPGATAEDARDLLPSEIVRSAGDHVIAIAIGRRIVASTALHVRP